jgi:hypothetical protein
VVPIDQEKYAEELRTPVLLFDCALQSGAVQHWSTHSVLYQTTRRRNTRRA